MDKNWNSDIVADQILTVMPRLMRLMVVHMTDITGNDTTMIQMSALHMLMENKMTTSDLAKKRHVSLQAASVFVQGLVERGWVVRVEDPDDRRRAILEVTTEGKKQADLLHIQLSRYLSELLSGLNDSELEAAHLFFDGIHRIVGQNNREDIDDYCSAPHAEDN